MRRISTVGVHIDKLHNDELMARATVLPMRMLPEYFEKSELAGEYGILGITQLKDHTPSNPVRLEVDIPTNPLKKAGQRARIQ